MKNQIGSWGNVKMLIGFQRVYVRIRAFQLRGLRPVLHDFSTRLLTRYIVIFTVTTFCILWCTCRLHLSVSMHLKVWNSSHFQTCSLFSKRIISSAAQCQTQEVETVGTCLLAAYCVSCWKTMPPSWISRLQVPTALYFDRTDLKSLKTALCCLSQPHAEIGSTEPKQAVSRLVTEPPPAPLSLRVSDMTFIQLLSRLTSLKQFASVWYN